MKFFLWLSISHHPRNKIMCIVAKEISVCTRMHLSVIKNHDMPHWQRHKSATIRAFCATRFKDFGCKGKGFEKLILPLQSNINFSAKA